MLCSLSIVNIICVLSAKTETTTQFQNFAIVVGFNDGTTTTRDVIKINLHRSNEISTKEQIPITMVNEASAAVYCNTMYVTGVGAKIDEIWKYKMASGWMKCASLVQGRRRHSAAFINEVLYICGGFLDSNKNVLDSVEAYNAITDKCAAVGKLIHCVKNSGNCVPFKRSLYIFGGADKDNKAFNHVQVYNTRENTCTLLSKPMPRGYRLLRAVLLETSVILIGPYTCFIFDIETEKWQEREQFKTDVSYFGLFLRMKESLSSEEERWTQIKMAKIYGNAETTYVMFLFRTSLMINRLSGRFMRHCLNQLFCTPMKN